MKFLKHVAFAAAMGCVSISAFAVGHYSPDQGYAYDVVRHGVMISEKMLPNEDGRNINGPTVIKAPSWLKNTPGKYLMYFSHHTGSYIRMAYADKLTGPWKIYEGGVMDLAQITKAGLSWGPDHVASPEIWIDNEHQELWMYFHTPITPAPKFDDPDYQKKVLQQKQATYRATSKDGIVWTTNGRKIAEHYLRVLPAEGGGFWGFARGGALSYSYDGKWLFDNLKPGPMEHNPITFSMARHVALLKEKDDLLLFYSAIADVPESILVTHIKMDGPDWTRWTASEPKLVLTPETDYEGANLPMKPGTFGSSKDPERGLRDPFVIRDDGKLYLFYTIQGEKGIACAELVSKH